MDANRLLKQTSRRRSIRKYDNDSAKINAQLSDIEKILPTLTPLEPNIKVAFQIVPISATNAKFGSFCLLCYSEEHPLARLNIGYMAEQFDLLLAEMNIGACWYGMAKPATEYLTLNGLNYFIMLTFGVCDTALFRDGSKDYKRKPLETLADAPLFAREISIAALAPSACNSQSWRFALKPDCITVYRETDIRTIIPKSRRVHYNEIDLGICLLFLETALLTSAHAFERTLLVGQPPQGSRFPIARYEISSKESR